MARARRRCQPRRTCIPVVVVLLHVKIVGGTTNYFVFNVCFLLSFVFLMIGGLADARRPTAGASAKAACKVVGKSLTGIVVWLHVVLYNMYLVSSGVDTNMDG